ncbi:MAG: cytochrome c oxidase subunit 3 [Acidobacteria bacterium]|nr:cytochrome c oxidase subunit 3 [Acidobacteriota bacterium]
MDAHTEMVLESRWAGGVRPYAMGSKKLGMWLFIISDALTFSAVIIAYSYLRVASPQWPTPFPFNPAIIFSTLMTFCLLSSSLTMVMAVSAAHRHQHRKTVFWLLMTMLFGTLFVGLHLTEWFHLIEEGLRTNRLPAEWVTVWPQAPQIFGSTFFGLTGLHMLHVSVGVIYLGTIALGFGLKKFESEDVEVSGLYWHFVDLVWMFIFPLVYLMSVRY